MEKNNKKILFCVIGIISAIIITVMIGILLENFVGQRNGQINNGSVSTVGGKEAKEARKKLSQRYNKDFVIKEVYSRKIGQGYYEVDAYPKGEPNVVFNVAIDTGDDNFSDNYVERHICNQISNQIYANIGKSENVYIFTEALGPQPITYDLEQSIQEYDSLNPYNKFKTNIFVMDETYELYDSYILFSNLGYLDISAEVYVVNNKQLQEIKTQLLNYPSTSNMDYLMLIQNLTYRMV